MKQILFSLIFTIPPCVHASGVPTGATNLGQVIEVDSEQIDAKILSTIKTSSGRSFHAYTQYTSAAEKGATLLLVTQKDVQYLCNMNGGVCAQVRN